MTKTMLIDAAHAEEVRVCVLENGKVEDFDFETSSRKPLRGNIYLARVTRVEPSLQAAFVEYGGNRHGFLAFNEIHPDYYQIPVSDRRLLQEAEAEEAALAAELDLDQRPGERGGDDAEASAPAGDDHDPDHAADDGDAPDFRDAEPAELEDEDAAALADAQAEANAAANDDAVALALPPLAELRSDARPSFIDAESADTIGDDDDYGADAPAETGRFGADAPSFAEGSEAPDDQPALLDEEPSGESADAQPGIRGQRRGELMERYREARRKRARLMRNYKIQEVVKRRQILLVQVVKEERGNKGAALTTYLSLAGRYCVLMPNTARGGGISRKIPIAGDRKRLRRVVDELNVPPGIGLIIRTAGAKRTKAEIKRDYEYLVRLWENIRELTLKSIAPCLIYEEASLIKRAIRDLYDKDIGKVEVQGEDGYREAKDFMKMLMPSHAKNVQAYRESTPLFLSYDVESQLDAMYQPTVRLKSGGYLVIHQTEALVAIDVNSGKATRERNIELTALRTNLEAAKEAARQCRLRDLAGLIVVDFIDMEENRNNRAVEKRLKEALKSDRARIQVGHISNFGLLEMSRQRRRSGIIDGTTHSCPTCGGSGVVRSDETAALRILRAIETEAIAGRAATIAVKASLEVALYILNQKREWLRRIEMDYALTVELVADATKAGDQYEIEKRGAPRDLPEAPVIRAEHGAVEEVADADAAEDVEPDEEADAETEADAEDDVAAERESGAEDGERRGRRRRRRRRGRRDDAPVGAAREPARESADATTSSNDEEDDERGEGAAERPGEAAADDGQRKRRRRGRRGGRRNRRFEGERPEEVAPAVSADSEQPEYAPLEFLEPAPLTADAAHASPTPLERPEPAVPAQESAPEAAEPEPVAAKPREPKPARRGWWQRAIGG